jgi:hypothetical protein
MDILCGQCCWLNLREKGKCVFYVQDVVRAWLMVDMAAATILAVLTFPTSLIFLPIYGSVFGLAIYAVLRECANALRPLQIFIVSVSPLIRP